MINDSITKAIIRFSDEPPTGAWETIATFHGLFKRQWHVWIKVISSSPDGYVVEMESHNAPLFRGDEAIEILETPSGKVIGRGHIIEVKLISNNASKEL